MLKRNQAKLTVVGLYVWHNFAYIPHMDQFESGIFVDVNPVLISGLNVNEMAEVIRKVRNAGHKRLPEPKNREEALARKDPILAATKAKSWKELAKTGASYSISWSDNAVRINMSKLDKKGRWEYDPQKMRILPPDTTIEQIVEIILEDVNSRPELIN